MYKYIIFDLGGVLIDWDPRHLYTKVFNNRDQMEYFLSEICTPDWNEAQDAGRSLEEGTNLLIRKHPNYEEEIRLFYDRWAEMLAGPITGTVQILEELANVKDIMLYALTNWSAETFPIAMSQFSFLKAFDGIVVSGHERMKKPEPAIYQLLLRQYSIPTEEAIFIDDNIRNVQASQELGLRSILFRNPEDLRHRLRELLLPV